MLYGDTGSIDVTTQVQKKMIKFWLKIKFSSEEKFSSVYANFFQT